MMKRKEEDPSHYYVMILLFPSPVINIQLSSTWEVKQMWLNNNTYFQFH